MRHCLISMTHETQLRHPTQSHLVLLIYLTHLPQVLPAYTCACHINKAFCWFQCQSGLGSCRVPDWVTCFFNFCWEFETLCVLFWCKHLHTVCLTLFTVVVVVVCTDQFRCAWVSVLLLMFPPFPPTVCRVKKILTKLMATFTWKVRKQRPLYHHRHWPWMISLLGRGESRHSSTKRPMWPWGRTWKHLRQQVWLNG